MKKAFTLAEVLITLGIIGVVAALTLPSVVQNYQKRSLEVATQKFYSVMSQAIKQYMADEGVDDLRQSSLIGYDDDSDEVITAKNDEFFKKYLKAQICEDGCFADNYKTQAGEISFAIGKSADDYDMKGRYLLPDGMVVDTYAIPVVGYDYIPGALHVDVNGRKGPNKWGQDIFTFGVYPSAATRSGNNVYVSDLKVLPHQSCLPRSNTSAKNSKQMLEESTNYK